MTPMPEPARKVEGGVAMRESWHFEIVDADLLPRDYMVPDEKAIGQVVRGLKGQTAIPGIEAYAERV